MLLPDQAGLMAPKYSAISRYDRATTSGCLFTTTRLTADEFLNAPSWQDYNGRQWNSNNDGSLDHAFEKQWLKQFFNRVISSSGRPNALSCGQTNQYFFPAASGCSYNVLQPVWNELASKTNLKFIAMSQYLNGNAKGIFFPGAGESFDKKYVGKPGYEIPSDGAGWEWPSTGTGERPYSARDALGQMITYFETVLYGVLEMKTDNMLRLIDETNAAIYEELYDIDTSIGENPDGLYGNTDAFHDAFPDGLKGAYQDFMTSTIEPQINAPPSYLTELWTDRIGPMLMKSPELRGFIEDEYNPIYNRVATQNAHYKSDDGFQWEYSFSFTWDIDARKRDLNSVLKARGSCTFPPPASTTTNPPASSSVSTCDGNQVLGPCLPASLPTGTPNSGMATPVCMKVNSAGYPFLRFNASVASEGAEEYCNNLISSETVIHAQENSTEPAIVFEGAEDSGWIALDILFDATYCEPGTSEEDQKVDFAAIGMDDCHFNLYKAVALSCAQDPTWEDYDPEHTLEGGMFGKSCAIWRMLGV